MSDSEAVQNTLPKNTKLIGAPDKLIPKLSTKVFFHKSEAATILTFTFNENVDSTEQTVIERILVDNELAKSIVNTFQKLLAEEGSDEK